jgi:hypothetical protein
MTIVGAAICPGNPADPRFIEVDSGCPPSAFSAAAISGENPVSLGVLGLTLVSGKGCAPPINSAELFPIIPRISPNDMG